jgi:hypothetical protein
LFTVSRNEQTWEYCSDRFIPMNYKAGQLLGFSPLYFENGYCISVKQTNKRRNYE